MNGFILDRGREKAPENCPVLSAQSLRKLQNLKCPLPRGGEVPGPRCSKPDLVSSQCFCSNSGRFSGSEIDIGISLILD